jgi:hypothetical protein
LAVPLGSTVVLNGAQAGPAEDCLWQAFQSCQAATLDLTALGPDASETHTFTTVPQRGACGLTDTRAQDVSLPPTGTPTQQPTTFTCASLAHPAGGGLVAQGCGADGDLCLPAPAAAPTARAASAAPRRTASDGGWTGPGVGA